MECGEWSLSAMKPGRPRCGSCTTGHVGSTIDDIQSPRFTRPPAGEPDLSSADGSLMKAIFSDAHGNLEALQAVLADASRERVSGVYNLGDTTGYGPNPIECLDLAMEMSVVLLGNNDQGILFD